MRQGKVFINRIFAGTLTESDEGLYSFEYDAQYLERSSVPVCLAMPVRKEKYESPSLFPFFSNLLSEGSNRIYKSRLNGVASDDEFGLLLKTASYDTIGSVTIEPVEQ
ncbi:MAG: HipA N-terminal domain-containing protein [Bacteroidales bacterium]|jgi:serine/threonine-protein kinase HipA|nr:HipA N-terminal domain-containing protein [Bacteroidales bacterium]